jgi:hypothetical protein
MPVVLLKSMGIHTNRYVNIHVAHTKKPCHRNDRLIIYLCYKIHRPLNFPPGNFFKENYVARELFSRGTISPGKFFAREFFRGYSFEGTFSRVLFRRVLFCRELLLDTTYILKSGNNCLRVKHLPFLF